MNIQEIQLTMKSRGFIDFYLPSKIAYHIKILLGSIFITMFFTLIWKGRLVDESFWMLIMLNIVQLEIFMWIALKIFTSKEVRPGESYRNAMLKRLLKFYLIVLIVASAILFMTIFITMSLGNQSFNDVLQHFYQQELRGFLISMLIGISIGSLVFFFMEWNNTTKGKSKCSRQQ